MRALIALILEWAKPTDEEIEAIALRETDPMLYKEFVPISRGPLFAFCGLFAISLVAVPSVIFRIMRGSLKKFLY